MSLTRGEILERTVDSIATIYAVVIALAISESIETLFAGNLHSAADLLSKFRTGSPAFIAFLFTVVPFWHGMNRHLVRCYLEREGNVKQGPLLFDLFTFIIESILLFVAGWALRPGVVSFICLGVLLLIDSVWGLASHVIHPPFLESHVLRWVLINVIAVGLGYVAYRLSGSLWILAFFAVARTITDYKLGWRFYFPNTVNGRNQ